MSDAACVFPNCRAVCFAQGKCVAGSRDPLEAQRLAVEDVDGFDSGARMYTRKDWNVDSIGKNLDVFIAKNRRVPRYHVTDAGRHAMSETKGYWVIIAAVVAVLLLASLGAIFGQ